MTSPDLPAELKAALDGKLRGFSRNDAAGRAASIVDHLEHVIRTIGEDHAALGSDWDGMVVTPRDMPTCLELPRLVELMLARRWSPVRIRKVLGGNVLRALDALRPQGWDA